MLDDCEVVVIGRDLQCADQDGHERHTKCKVPYGEDAEDSTYCNRRLQN